MARGESARARQQAYYRDAAASYRASHEIIGSPHDRSLQFIARVLPSIGAQSLLDVGAGAGRALRFFSSRFSHLRLAGVEPVPEMIDEAERSGVPAGTIRLGDGANLPFDRGAFDVVTAFGVLHHVPDPSLVVRELTRVARKAIFLSDSNRFGQGRGIARFAKLALDATGLWPTFEFLRTRGRGYHESAGDGVFYSYSIFHSLGLLREFAPELLFVEVENARTPAGPWSDPLCNAATLLVGAIKQD
jgi:SAM-dependent methyltransferase